MSYQEYKQIRGDLESRLAAASSDLAAVRASKALELSIAESGPMGLTPDAIKFSPEYRAAKYKVDRCFAALRDFNRKYATRFQPEIRADIEAKRLAKLATA